MRVLLVEDEPDVALPLRRALEREGWMVCACDTGAVAIESARTWAPDIVLLDLQLPDTDGTHVARAIREWSSVPIIMVTGRQSEQAKIAGLDLGADDYIVKPFSLQELFARMRAAHRRSSIPVRTAERLHHRDVVLDLGTASATRDGRDLGLSAKEFELLRLLMTRPGQIVRRDELGRAIWGRSPTEAANTLDVHMSWLRRKLGDDPKAPSYIETVRGVGFRLVPE